MWQISVGQLEVPFHPTYCIFLDSHNFQLGLLYGLSSFVRGRETFSSLSRMTSRKTLNVESSEVNERPSVASASASNSKSRLPRIPFMRPETRKSFSPLPWITNTKGLSWIPCRSTAFFKPLMSPAVTA